MLKKLTIYCFYLLLVDRNCTSDGCGYCYRRNDEFCI